MCFLKTAYYIEYRDVYTMSKYLYTLTSNWPIQFVQLEEPNLMHGCSMVDHRPSHGHRVHLSKSPVSNCHYIYSFLFFFAFHLAYCHHVVGFKPNKSSTLLALMQCLQWSLPPPLHIYCLYIWTPHQTFIERNEFGNERNERRCRTYPNIFCTHNVFCDPIAEPTYRVGQLYMKSRLNC